MSDLSDIHTLPRPASGGFGIEMPMPDDWCETCGKQYGRPQVCKSCRRYHRHGMIHPPGKNVLRWLCDECYADVFAGEA